MGWPICPLTLSTNGGGLAAEQSAAGHAPVTASAGVHLIFNPGCPSGECTPGHVPRESAHKGLAMSVDNRKRLRYIQIRYA